MFGFKMIFFKMYSISQLGFQGDNGVDGDPGLPGAKGEPGFKVSY